MLLQHSERWSLWNTMYIRDFEGLRIDKVQLNEMGYSTSHFHEKSRILT